MQTGVQCSRRGEVLHKSHATISGQHSDRECRRACYGSENAAVHLRQFAICQFDFVCNERIQP